jgi:hypothetical protein
LDKLKGWLDANEEEAVKRDKQRDTRHRFTGLRTHVGVLAGLRSLPNDEFHVVGYKRSGRPVDVPIPIRLARLLRLPHHWSGRELEKELRISRSTLRHYTERMEEFGFDPERFTTEEVNYIVRGPRKGARNT